jgi:hypothetical protein
MSHPPGRSGVPPGRSIGIADKVGEEWIFHRILDPQIQTRAVNSRNSTTSGIVAASVAFTSDRSCSRCGGPHQRTHSRGGSRERCRSWARAWADFISQCVGRGYSTAGSIASRRGPGRGVVVRARWRQRIGRHRWWHAHLRSSGARGGLQVRRCDDIYDRGARGPSKLEDGVGWPFDDDHVDGRSYRRWQRCWNLPTDQSHEARWTTTETTFIVKRVRIAHSNFSFVSL